MLCLFCFGPGFIINVLLRFILKDHRLHLFCSCKMCLGLRIFRSYQCLRRMGLQSLRVCLWKLDFLHDLTSEWPTDRQYSPS